MSVEGCRGERTIGAALPGVQPRHVYEHVAKADSAGSGPGGGMEAALSPDTAPAQIRPLGGHGDIAGRKSVLPEWTGDEGDIGIGRRRDSAGRRCGIPGVIGIRRDRDGAGYLQRTGCLQSRIGERLGLFRRRD